MEFNLDTHAKRKLALILGIFLLFSSVTFVFAQQDTSSNEKQEKAESQKHSNSEKDVKAIQDDLEAKKKKIDGLKSQIARYEQSIRSRQKEASSLANQISILSESISKTELDIELTQNQIEKTNIEIRKTESEIDSTKQEITNKKESLAKYLRLLYRMDQKEPFEILLEKKSLSDYFVQAGIAERLQNRIKESKQKLDSEKKILETKNGALQDKKLSLVKFSSELSTKQSTLEQNRGVRTQILAETKNSETKFRAALVDLKEEQSDINADIVTLEKQIREKVQSGGLKKLKELGDASLIWPVPNNGITAYFHDPDYPFRYVFEHPAIDIRTPQGTSIRAPAPGFVARVKRGGRTARGYGYSYVMLIHNDGISTVYGHVSQILVEEDQFVNQGDVIALSGGRPGTPGSGPLTTGPHLHFEVRVNGVPDDPLNYLP